MHRGQKTDGVDTVSQAAKGQCELHTQLINEGAGEEADDGESAVERDELILRSALDQGPSRSMAWKGIEVGSTYHIIRQRGVLFPSATQAAERVEHARAKKAHKRDEQQLGPRRGIPRDHQAADSTLPVFPAVRSRSGLINGKFKAVDRIVV